MQSSRKLTPTRGMILQRACACGERKDGAATECEGCKRKKVLNRSPRAGTNAAVPAAQHLSVPSSGGFHLPPDLHDRFATLYGSDFSHVKLHDDAASHDASRSVDARAFTLGAHVHFAAGEYRPHDRQGFRLLAHELAHTMQQRDAGPSTGPLEIDPPDSAFEREADSAADAAARGEIARSPTRSTAAVQRLQRDTNERTTHEENRAVRDGVPVEKWSEQVEGLYRKAGDFERADAVANCRRNGASACALLLTLREVDALYTLAQDSKGDKKKIEQGIKTAVPALGYLLVSPAAIEGAIGAAPVAAGATATTASTVGTLAGALAIVGICVLAGIELWLLGRFQAKLRSLGFVVLEDPLRQAICHSCHTSPAPSSPRSTREALRRWNDPQPDLLSRPRARPSPEPLPKSTTDIAPLPRTDTEEKKRRPCPFPTGLTPADPIEMQWYKPRSDDLYPPSIVLAGHTYNRDEPAHLPDGEPIGVDAEFWPRKGKLVQLAPDCGVPRKKSLCPKAGQFRDTLTDYGFDWHGGEGKKNRRFLQADHVQDVQWGRPDAQSLDVFQNLWPMDGAANASAGALQNQVQVVSFCEEPQGPPVTLSIGEMMRLGRAGRPYFGRYFVINTVSL